MVYTYAEKCAILEYARDNGTIAAARKYNVIGSQIQDWVNHTNQK